MKNLRRFALLCLALVVGFPANSYGHFLWLHCIDGKVHVYFGEDASPDDPELLKLVEKAEVWSHSQAVRGGEAKLTPIAIAKGEDSLVGELPKQAGTIGLNHNYGVMSRGGETFSLRYYAKTYTPTGITTAAAVENKDKLPLEITPSWQGQKLVLKVTWLGKPAADSEVVLSGAGLASELKTDAQGEVSIEPKEAGILSVRAKLVESKTGSEGDKSYTSIRHYTTLTLPVEPHTVLSGDHQLAPLEKGITSLGAAVVGEDLYIFGGHFGGAHHYSTEGQSGEFRKLSLAKPGAWEVLPAGPKLTGLALVAHAGKLYRIGGFAAKNDESKKQDLWSQDGFAAFDIAAGKWTDLPALPAGRSSHDAAVLDGKLYVVGGWNMAGDKETSWHTKGLVCDLASPTLEWKEFDVPFKRRAVSLAAFNGKIYVIGGMQEEGSTTTRTDVYDPASQTWAEGPALQGNSMDGFGTSSFAVGDKLLVSTMSGSVQQLSADGKSWNLVGQLKQPRFFHRLLATPKAEAVIVGGASMTTGKTVELELLSAAPAESK